MLSLLGVTADVACGAAKSVCPFGRVAYIHGRNEVERKKLALEITQSNPKKRLRPCLGKQMCPTHQE